MSFSSRFASIRLLAGNYISRLWLLLQKHFPAVAAKLPPYWRLTRMNRPIGTFLVLWPTLWCLWIAGEGNPSPGLVVIFVLGSLLMRSAGCCINDYADRNFDGRVARTLERPLASGEVSPKEALLLCTGLCVAAFLLVLLTNTPTILMSFGALATALIYPFMKRYTHLPQVVLGAAFSWGGLMAFTAQTETLPAQAWLLYIANLLWTIAYDTQYAMVDREDDLKVGIKSTAILFAEADIFVIAFLQLFFLITLSLSANYFGLGNAFELSLLLAGLLFIYQHSLAWTRQPAGCFKAFLNNNYVGMIIFVGTVLDYLL
jgi:4-hydroxybenzoate polyprenyltransferase